MGDGPAADVEDDADDIWGDGAEREDSRDDADAIADYLKGWEWNAHCAAVQAAMNAPLIEDCRPVMRAAFEDFLNDRGRWADDIINAVDDGRRMNRLFDGDRFASDREDALLRLGWLMAYYHPKDNPLTEAQSKRARALGLFDDRDGSPRVKTDDEVVLGLGYLLRDLWSEEPWPDGPGVLFPKHVGHAGAIAELKRWYKLVVGRELGDVGAMTKPQANGKTAKPRLTVEQADERAREIGRDDRDFREKPTVRKWAKRIGCSTGLVTKLPYYATCARKAGTLRRGKQAKTVTFTQKMEAAVGEGEKDFVLDELAETEEARSKEQAETKRRQEIARLTREQAIDDQTSTVRR